MSPRGRLLLALVVGLFVSVAAGCGPSSTPSETTSTLVAPAASVVPDEAERRNAADGEPLNADQVTIPEVIPTVTIEQHSVPLDQIYFDTFQPVNRAVPLTEASPGLIERLRDAIPPLHSPRYEPGVDAAWLNGEDLVLGYANGEEAWAFPLRILNFHEIVNDVLAGEPVLISYCPLCYSGIVYSRRLGERTLTFGNTSALYQSDMVMVDYQTGSYWWQVAGSAIVGSLTGERLKILPSQIADWESWLALYPATQVLSRDTGFRRDYGRNPFGGFEEALNSGSFAFPVSGDVDDPRLKPATRVLAVQRETAIKVYPLSVDRPTAYNDQLNGEAVVVFVQSQPVQGAAYSAIYDGRRLHFQAQGDLFMDEETDSTWDLAGRAVSGPLAGGRLTPLPARTTYWYAMVAAEPDLQLFDPGSGSQQTP